MVKAGVKAGSKELINIIVFQIIFGIIILFFVKACN